MSKSKLTHRSQEFLENLHVYLFSSGKNTEEIQNIMDELESHLVEAEADGKSIEKIIGNSPKEYMNQISSEMAMDKQEWIKSMVLIIFGSFTFKIFSDLLDGSLSYSLLDIMGHIMISTVFIITVFSLFKYVSTTAPSFKVQALLYFGVGILPIILFIGLIYLNRVMNTPLIDFGPLGSVIIGIVAGLFLIGASIWTKTWTLIIIIGLLVLPDFLLSLTSFPYETQLILSLVFTYGGIGIYLFTLTKLEKSNVS